MKGIFGLKGVLTCLYYMFGLFDKLGFYFPNFDGLVVFKRNSPLHLSFSFHFFSYYPLLTSFLIFFKNQT